MGCVVLVWDIELSCIGLGWVGYVGLSWVCWTVLVCVLGCVGLDVSGWVVLIWMCCVGFCCVGLYWWLV